jgi:hypothetical protein
MSLDEALAFHGLTRDRMASEMIRWVESIRLESPELYGDILYDAPDVKRVMEIKRWDFVFSTGITLDYPARRGWNDFMAIREFLQNALDIEERMFGYEAIEVGVWVDKLGLHISDRGPGVTYEAFRLGASEKACYERGFFGEGLKVGMAHLVRRGCLVYVFNRRGQVFKAFVPLGSDLVLVAMGRYAKPVAGTEVIIYGLPEIAAEWSDPARVRRIIFKEWLKDPNLEVLTVKKWKGPDCPHDRPNFIVSARNGSNVDFLWVRDIVVNNISKIAGHPSIFGYNLWWCGLEPNRVSVSSIPELGMQAARAFDAKATRVLLDRVVEGFRVKRGYFETETVQWSSCDPDARKAAADWVREKGVGVTDNERTLDWALYLGVTPLIVPWRMRELFSEAQTLEEVISMQATVLKATAEENVVPISALTLTERCNLRAAEIAMEHVHISLVGEKEKAPPVIVTKIPVAGTAIVDKIYITREQLENPYEAMKAVLHEYAHIYGERRYGAARDISEEFEKALSEVVGSVPLMEMDDKLAIERALKGAWGARSWKWTPTGYKRRPPLSWLLWLALDDGVVKLGLPSGKMKLSETKAREIEFKVPLIVWVSLSRDEIAKIREGISIPVEYHSKYNVEQILEWGFPYADIKAYRAAVEKDLTRIMEEIDTDFYRRFAHIILLYNPEEDDYEVWKVVPIRD